MMINARNMLSTLGLAAAMQGVGCGSYEPNPNSVNVIGKEDAGRFQPPADANQATVEGCLGAYDQLRRSVQFTYHVTRAGSRIGCSPFTMSSLPDALPQADGGANYPFVTLATFAAIPTSAVPPASAGNVAQALRALEALRNIRAPLTGNVLPEGNQCLISMSWVFSITGLPTVMIAGGDAGVQSCTTTDPTRVMGTLLTAASDAGVADGGVSTPINISFTAPMPTPGEIFVRNVPVCGVSTTAPCATAGIGVTVDVRFGPRVDYDGGVSNDASTDRPATDVVTDRPATDVTPSTDGGVDDVASDTSTVDSAG